MLIRLRLLPTVLAALAVISLASELVDGQKWRFQCEFEDRSGKSWLCQYKVTNKQNILFRNNKNRRMNNSQLDGPLETAGKRDGKLFPRTNQDNSL